jgi:hypothetical protein
VQVPGEQVGERFGLAFGVEVLEAPGLVGEGGQHEGGPRDGALTDPVADQAPAVAVAEVNGDLLAVLVEGGPGGPRRRGRWTRRTREGSWHMSGQQLYAMIVVVGLGWKKAGLAGVGWKIGAVPSSARAGI